MIIYKKCFYVVKIIQGSLFFFFQKRIDPVCIFLASDIQNDIEIISAYKNYLNDAMQRDTAYFLSGNCCDVQIDKDIVFIRDRYALDTMINEVQLITDIALLIVLCWDAEIKKVRLLKMHPLREVFDPDYRVYTFLASVYHKQVDFKESFLFYVNSESAKEIRYTKKMLKHFLAEDVCLAQKRAYIEHCADGVDFKKENIDPLVWLEDQLELFPKSNEWVETYLWPVIDAITTELVQFKKWIFNER